MAKFLTTKEVGKRMGLPQREVIRRIRRDEIKGQKFGWIWVVEETEVEAAMGESWYKRQYSESEESTSA